MDSELRISVASIGESGRGLQNELQMLKSAILYADKVTLISPLAALYLPMEDFATASIDEKLHAFFSMAEAAGLMKEPFKSQYELFLSLGRKRRRTSAEILGYERLRRGLEKAFNDTPLWEQAKQIAYEAGIGKMKRAIDSGILTLQKLETFGGGLAEAYMSTVLAVLLEQVSYPLLDSRTGNLVNSLFDVVAFLGPKIGIQQSLPEPTRSKAKQACLNQVILTGVPHFPSATLDMIIDIRSELSTYLAGYRSALLEFAHDINSLPWSASFEAEVDDLYQRKVVPRISALSEEIEANSELRILGRRASESPALWMAAFGIVALAVQGDLQSLLGRFSEYAPALGIAGAVLPELFKGRNEHKKQDRQLRQHPLYLLSRVETLLKDK